MKQTDDGGFIITGRTHLEGEDGEDGGWDILLIKTHPNGVIEWGQTLGGSLNDVGWSVSPTSDGGYAVAGYTVVGEWVIKTTESGLEQWNQSFENADGHDEAGNASTQTSDGCYLMLGNTSDGIESLVYLVKACEPAASIDTFSTQGKKLTRIIDFWGRQVDPTPNQLLLYLYDDGSVEQRCIIER